MTDTDEQNIGNIYFGLLNQQQFVAEELDYNNFNKHIPTLQALATIGNSGISVFDLFKKEHIFYSPNFCAMLGYNVQEIFEKMGVETRGAATVRALEVLSSSSQRLQQNSA